MDKYNENPLVNNQTEYDSEPDNENEIINIINSSMCYFTRDLRPINLNLICYYCNKKCYPIDIQSFTNRHIKGVSIYDIPICPYCHIDAIVDENKLRQNKIEEYKLLYQMKKLMFE